MKRQSRLFNFGFRGAKGLVFAFAAFAAMWISGSFETDAEIANSWNDYSYGGSERMIKNLNLSRELGASMVFLSYRPDLLGQVVGLEEHERNWHFDDIGYILFGQIASLITGEITPGDLAWAHNAIAALACMTIAITICLAYDSFIAGVFVLVSMNAVRVAFAPHIYGSTSQHTMLTVGALVIIAVLLALIYIQRNGRPFATTAMALLAGAIVACLALIRHPLGMAGFLSVFAAIVIFRSGYKRVAPSLAAVVIGWVMVVNVMPGLIAIHRDVKMGWYDGFSFSYFKSPPSHRPFFSILAGIGRYPNSLGIVLTDSAIDKFLGPRYKGTNYARDFDKVAKREYFNYIREHPLEYASYIARGASELIYVTPAITFQHHGKFFAGVPVVPKNKADLIDPADLHLPSGGLMNLRFAYLDLTPLQWALYILAVGAFTITVAAAVYYWRKQRAPESGVIFVLLFYLGLLAFPRAIIPLYGQDFAITFWSVSILGPVLVFFMIKKARQRVFAKQGIG